MVAQRERARYDSHTVNLQADFIGVICGKTTCVGGVVCRCQYVCVVTASYYLVEYDQTVQVI